MYKIKQKPEFFIVSEVAQHKINKGGNFFLYLLIKRNMNTLDIAKKLDLSYAGLKDKQAITFQYVSSKKDYGDIYKEKQMDSFFILKKIGKINKKIKIGMLEGNFFSIKLDKKLEKRIDYFINYYDFQRIKPYNIQKGKELLFLERKLNKKENFFVDAYISYLWNKSLKLFLKENFEGKEIDFKDIKLFIPKDIDLNKLPKFWTVLGYKAKLENSKIYYENVIKEEGFEFEEFIEILKKKRIKGDYRRTYEKAKNLKIQNNWISFYLKKGAYATMLLRFLYAKNSIFSIK